MDGGKYRLGRFRGRYAVIWPSDSGTRRVSLRTKDKDLARVRFNDFIHKLKTQASAPESLTIGAIIDAYLKARPQERRKALDAFWGDRLPEHVTEDLCGEYEDLRLDVDEASAATIYTELGLLSCALIHAKRQQWIAEAPFVWRTVKGEARDVWLTQDQADQVIAGCHADHVRLFAMIGFDTGARSTAILQLRWPQVKLDSNRIDFNAPGIATPGNKRRAIVPLTPRLREALTAAREAAMSDTGYVISYGGEPIKKIRKGFARAVERASLGADVTPHVMRHSVATWLAQKSVPEHDACGFLMMTPETYRRYCKRHDPRFMSNAVAALTR